MLTDMRKEELIQKAKEFLLRECSGAGKEIPRRIVILGAAEAVKEMGEAFQRAAQEIIIATDQFLDTKHRLKKIFDSFNIPIPFLEEESELISYWNWIRTKFPALKAWQIKPKLHQVYLARQFNRRCLFSKSGFIPARIRVRIKNL